VEPGVPVAHVPKKRHANDDLHPARENKRQRRQIDHLKKEKDCLRKRLTRSQTKIGNLKVDIADTQTELRTQQAEYKDCIAQLNEEKEAAEKRAQRAQACVDSQQSRIDALYAKTRAIAIADA
jgi:chromosome segregation ATPase